MTEFIHPGVRLEELSSGMHSIPGVSTSTSGLVGTDMIRRLRILVPRGQKGWQDANAHDPGVALLELAAWLAEELASAGQQIPPQGHPYAERLVKAARILNKRSAQATPPKR